MSKMIKVRALYASTMVTLNLWGVKFEENEDGHLIGQVPEADLEAMIEAGRVEVYKEPKKAKTADMPNFASDEAGELHAKMVTDKVLTKAEWKKVEGTGEDDAITVGDLNDYVASKTPPPPPPANK